MFKYFISIYLLFVFADGFSQDQKTVNKEISKDSISYKTAYGLRLGIDISKPILSLMSDTYSGFEIVGDYRISKRIYIAAEIGYEEETTEEGITEEYFTNSTSKGSYVRLGFNFNAYKNWLNMNNEITIGYRYGFSLFDQTLNSYKPNVNSQNFPSNIITTPQTSNGLNAHWSEVVFGIKVATFKNLFVSISGSYKILMSIENPENFKSLYSPGFNRIFESNTGFGFNYTISYLIPFSKK